VKGYVNGRGGRRARGEKSVSADEKPRRGREESAIQFQTGNKQLQISTSDC
jgi:hypothetical protein